jgi:hypothetical protein
MEGEVMIDIDWTAVPRGTSFRTVRGRLKFITQVVEQPDEDNLLFVDSYGDAYWVRPSDVFSARPARTYPEKWLVRGTDGSCLIYDDPVTANRHAGPTGLVTHIPEAEIEV